VKSEGLEKEEKEFISDNMKNFYRIFCFGFNSELSFLSLLFTLHSSLFTF